jgi:glycogen(starch) synthase
MVSRTTRSVCLITKDYPPSVPGGIPRAVQMQAHHLAAAGVDVHVITKSQNGAEATREDRGVIVHELPEPGLAVPPGLYYLEIPLWSFVTAAKFAELDANVGFDVVEAPDYRGEALHLVTRPETALIVWLHSTLRVAWNCDPGYVRTPADDAWHALEMSALERADLLLAPSQLLLDTTAEFLGERMRPAELMPYLFDSTQFPVHRRRGDGPIRVLFYGRLEARKNPELAMHAVAAARADGHRVDLTLMGHDHWDYRGRVLDPLQAELGLEEVSYIPHVDVETIRAVLAETDVAILASRFDNSPLTIFEALSSGVPVITSDRVGTASWIEAENGLLALPVDDPADFGRLAARAMADPTWMSSGTRAAARIRELLADPSLVQAWANAFDGTDEITLVIHAPRWSAEEVAMKLGPLVTRAGLDGDDAADLLAHTVDDTAAVIARLAAGVNAVLSRRSPPPPFDALRSVDETSLSTLRDDLARSVPHAKAA